MMDVEAIMFEAYGEGMQALSPREIEERAELMERVLQINPESRENFSQMPSELDEEAMAMVLEYDESAHVGAVKKYLAVDVKPEHQRTFIDEINAATVAIEEARLKAEEAAAGHAGERRQLAVVRKMERVEEGWACWWWMALGTKTWKALTYAAGRGYNIDAGPGGVQSRFQQEEEQVGLGSEAAATGSKNQVVVVISRQLGILPRVPKTRDVDEEKLMVLARAQQAALAEAFALMSEGGEEWEELRAPKPERPKNDAARKAYNAIRYTMRRKSAGQTTRFDLKKLDDAQRSEPEAPGQRGKEDKKMMPIGAAGGKTVKAMLTFARGKSGQQAVKVLGMHPCAGGMLVVDHAADAVCIEEMRLSARVLPAALQPAQKQMEDDLGLLPEEGCPLFGVWSIKKGILSPCAAPGGGPGSGCKGSIGSCRPGRWHARGMRLPEAAQEMKDAWVARELRDKEQAAADGRQAEQRKTKLSFSPRRSPRQEEKRGGGKARAHPYAKPGGAWQYGVGSSEWQAERMTVQQYEELEAAKRRALVEAGLATGEGGLAGSSTAGSSRGGGKGSGSKTPFEFQLQTRPQAGGKGGKGVGGGKGGSKERESTTAPPAPPAPPALPEASGGSEELNVAARTAAEEAKENEVMEEGEVAEATAASGGGEELNEAARTAAVVAEEDEEMEDGEVAEAEATAAGTAEVMQQQMVASMAAELVEAERTRVAAGMAGVHAVEAITDARAQADVAGVTMEELQAEAAAAAQAQSDAVEETKAAAAAMKAKAEAAVKAKKEARVAAQKWTATRAAAEATSLAAGDAELAMPAEGAGEVGAVERQLRWKERDEAAEADKKAQAERTTAEAAAAAAATAEEDARSAREAAQGEKSAADKRMRAAALAAKKAKARVAAKAEGETVVLPHNLPPGALTPIAEARTPAGTPNANEDVSMEQAANSGKRSERGEDGDAGPPSKGGTGGPDEAAETPRRSSRKAPVDGAGGAAK